MAFPTPVQITDMQLNCVDQEKSLLILHSVKRRQGFYFISPCFIDRASVRNMALSHAFVCRKKFGKLGMSIFEVNANC